MAAFAHLEARSASPTAGSALARFTTEWIANEERFALLAPEWQQLARQINCGNAFTSFPWVSTWWKHWGGGAQLAVITVRDQQQRLVGAAPFYVSQSGLRRLGFIADQNAGSDYLDILAAPGFDREVAAEVAHTLLTHRQHWDYIELSDTGDSPALRHFISLLVEQDLHVQQERASVCPYIDLPGTFEAYTATLSGQYRRDVNRRWRMLQREHGATFETHSTPREIREYFPELCRLHALRFASLERESAFLDPSVSTFHADSALALAESGVARMHLLRIRGQVVAALLGFSANQQYQYFQMGFDPAWNHAGLGKVLLARTIEYAILTGHNRFDFLRGGEAYKSSWTSTVSATYVWRAFDRRPSALLARGFFAARSAAGDAKHYLNGGSNHSASLTRRYQYQTHSVPEQIGFGGPNKN